MRVVINQMVKKIIIKAKAIPNKTALTFIFQVYPFKSNSDSERSIFLICIHRLMFIKTKIKTIKNKIKLKSNCKTVSAES